MHLHHYSIRDTILTNTRMHFRVMQHEAGISLECLQLHTMHVRECKLYADAHR